MTHHYSPITHRPIETHLVETATELLSRMSRHEEYLDLPSLAIMLTRPWRAAGYLPVPNVLTDYLPHDTPGGDEWDEWDEESDVRDARAAQTFVILRHTSVENDYLAFHAHGPHYRGDYTHIPFSQRVNALLADADAAWAGGVRGTLSDVLDWAQVHTDHLDAIEATLTLHDPRVRELDPKRYRAALALVQKATKDNVRARLREVAEWAGSRGFVPANSGLRPNLLHRAAYSHLVQWHATRPVAEFHPGTEAAREAEAFSEAMDYLHRRFPRFMPTAR